MLYFRGNDYNPYDVCSANRFRMNDVIWILENDFIGKSNGGNIVDGNGLNIFIGDSIAVFILLSITSEHRIINIKRTNRFCELLNSFHVVTFLKCLLLKDLKIFSLKFLCRVEYKNPPQFSLRLNQFSVYAL